MSLAALVHMASADEPKPDRTTSELVAELKPSIVVISFAVRAYKLQDK